MTEFDERRRMMVDTQVRPSDVTKFPIIDAMLNVPRENFVPDSAREAAYSGDNLRIGDGRVLLEPRTLAKMLDALDIRGDEMVLDIGCGYGYSAAIAGRLAAVVVALECNEDMAEEAPAQLSEVGADNVIVHHGPLQEGAEEHGPYDVIIVQGGVEEFPEELSDQLKDGGRVACLFMNGALGAVKIGYKSQGALSWRFEFNASAPVLEGFQSKAVFVL